MKIITTEKGIMPKAILCSTGAAFSAVYIIVILSGDTLMPSARLSLCLLSCLFLFIGARIGKHKPQNRAMRIVLWLMFFMYLSLLLTLTLFDPSFGRSGGEGLSRIRSIDINSIKTYAEGHCNLVPFETVKRFYSIIDRGDGGRHAFMVNIVGNIVAFMPFGFFYPVLFKKLRKLRFFIPVMIFTVAFVESAQIILMTGSFDSDDIILNCAGAAIIFMILRFPPLRKALSKLILVNLEK